VIVESQTRNKGKEGDAVTELMLIQPESVLSLGTLADRANAAHREAESMAYAALEHARQAGEALLEAKEQLPHGDWGDWLRDHFEGSPRTAQMYMRVVRGWGELEGKTQRVADLSLRQAVGLLEKPRSTREPAPNAHGKRWEQHPLLRGLLLGVEDRCFPGLLDSIRRYGCLTPIVTDQRGFIIDGWLRYQACCIAGLGFAVNVIQCDEDEVLDIFISYNFRRAHYTEDQLAMAAVRLVEYEASMDTALVALDTANDAFDWEGDPSVDDLPALSAISDLATTAIDAAGKLIAGCLKPTGSTLEGMEVTP
jgi:hypothetical protein